MGDHVQKMVCLYNILCHGLTVVLPYQWWEQNGINHQVLTSDCAPNISLKAQLYDDIQSSQVL